MQLATGTKIKFTEIVRQCPLEMNGLNTLVDLNVIPLGSYDVLIGMDYSNTRQSMFDSYNKTYMCLDEEGNIVAFKGIHISISLRQVTTL